LDLNWAEKSTTTDLVERRRVAQKKGKGEGRHPIRHFGFAAEGWAEIRAKDTKTGKNPHGRIGPATFLICSCEDHDVDRRGNAVQAVVRWFGGCPTARFTTARPAFAGR